MYLSPLEHALVPCCDEKSQVQALDRSQPGLPLKKGRAVTLTHNYKRNGTTTLFVALNVLGAGIFRTVPELIAVIEEYITMHNQNPKHIA